MAHTLLEHARVDEGREKRLDSLEQRTIQVENMLLRTSQAALEKRVAELEASLKESNEECDKLKQTIAHMQSAEKDVTSSKKEENIEIIKNGLICNEKKDYTDNFTNDELSDSTSSISKEEEIIYERILKLVENMKSEGQKAINMKIPTESQLPMRPATRQSSKSISSKSPSPTDGLISPSKMIGRVWTPTSGISVLTNIPTSRAATPSGAISPPNSTQIPTKSPTSPPNKPSQLPSQLPSRSSTPVHSQTLPIQHIASPIKKQQRSRTGSCCSSIPSPSTPPPAHNISGLPTGLSSGLSKIQYQQRRIAC
uniref:Uncharacterized protein n=1 Tax=Anthurium amnicola TaxID=1678845 RepID=A0A1D1YI67_9ARAE